MVDGKETGVPFSFFEEADDFEDALRAYIAWQEHLAEWHLRAMKRPEDALRAIREVLEVLDQL